MDTFETEGDSIDAAIAAALETLGADREQVEIEILRDASRGFLGIGKRRAKVRATRRQPIEQTAGVSGEVTASATPRDTPAPQAPVTTPTATQQLGLRAQHTAQEILRRMDIDARVSLTDQSTEHVSLELHGDASGILIGRKGRMLDALEYLLNRIVARDDPDAPRIALDTEQYRERRRQSLEDLARRMADEAKEKGRPVTLNAMSPRDRRAVHLFLQKETSLQTRSAGRGYFRKVVITPRRGTRRPPTDSTAPKATP